MLALIKGSSILRDVTPGDYLEFAPGLSVAPAKDGWSYCGLYRLATIATQEAPPGSRVGSWSLQMVNGVPTNVPEILPPLTPEEVREGMPTLTPRQVRTALLSIGITEADVDMKLVNDPAVMIEWKWATYFRRNHPLINALGSLFSITATQIDSLWDWAAAL